MYPATQFYFLSIDKPPVLLKHFFENLLSELYMKHLQSFVAVFHKQVPNIEQLKVSLVKVVANLNSVKTTIFKTKRQMFVSVQVKSNWQNSEKREKSGSVIYSCQTYLYCTIPMLPTWINEPLYLLNLIVLTG